MGESLWDRFASWENLLAARLARRRKRFRPEVVEFESRREENLLALRRELEGGAYRPGPYRRFVIQDPKVREIAAPSLRDRVTHHAIMNVLGPVWDRKLPPQSFACRPGLGTHRAMRYAQRLARRFPWYVKIDVARFYPSVRHDRLKETLRPHVPDERLMGVLERVIDSYEPGIPIGALTSQWFGLMMLRDVQVELVNRGGLGVAAYMDDLLVYARSREELGEVRRRVFGALEMRGLAVHPGKRVIHRVSDGIPFVGFRVFGSHVRVRTPSKVRSCRRIRALAERSRQRRLGVERVRSSVASWFGHWGWANTYYLRKARLCTQRF